MIPLRSAAAVVFSLTLALASSTSEAQQPPARTPAQEAIARGLTGPDAKARDAALAEARQLGEAAGPLARELCFAANAAAADLAALERAGRATDKAKATIALALLALKKAHPKVHPHVAALVTDEKGDNHLAASHALAAMKRDAEPATPVLRGHLDRAKTFEYDHRFYSFADRFLIEDLAALAAVAPADAEVLEVATALTKHTVPKPKNDKEPKRDALGVRRAAVTALGAIAEAEPAVRMKVVEQLGAALADPTNPDVVRVAVLKALRLIAEAEPAVRRTVVERLGAALVDPTNLDDVRVVVLQALGAVVEIDPASRQDAVPSVHKALKEEARKEGANVLLVAISALAGCGPDAAPALDDLGILTADSRKPVRDAAETALDRIDQDTKTTGHLKAAKFTHNAVPARVYVAAFRFAGAGEDAFAAVEKEFAALPRTADAVTAAGALAQLKDADKKAYAKVREASAKLLVTWGTEEAPLRDQAAKALLGCAGDPACRPLMFAALAEWGKRDGRFVAAHVGDVADLFVGEAGFKALELVGAWGDAHAEVRDKALARVADQFNGTAGARALGVVGAWGDAHAEVRDKALARMVDAVRKGPNSGAAVDVLGRWAEKYAAYRPTVLPVLADAAGGGSDRDAVRALARSTPDAVRLVKGRLADPATKANAAKLLDALKPVLLQQGKAEFEANKARSIDGLAEAGSLTPECAEWLVQCVSRARERPNLPPLPAVAAAAARALENLDPDAVGR